MGHSEGRMSKFESLLVPGSTELAGRQLICGARSINAQIVVGGKYTRQICCFKR